MSRAVAPIVAMLVVLVSMGCGRQPQSPAPAKASGDGYPLSVVDAQEVAVTIPHRPQRIVSVSPAVTEMLFAIGAGDRVVAVTDQCNYPAEVRKRPKVGRWFTPSTEKALAARPDLVIGQQGNPPEFVRALRKAGCTVFTILEPKELASVSTDLRQLGQLTGAREGAEDAIAEMEQRLAEIETRIADVPEGERPTAFLFLQIGPIWTAGSGTFQGDAIRAAGARNVGDRVKGFKQFSIESLVAVDPDFLLVATMAGDSEVMKRQVLSHPALRNLTAARRGRILVLEEDEVMRPGPRIVQAVEAMGRAFYPGRFNSSSTNSR